MAKSEAAKRAAQVRASLKAGFPGVKFSVRSDSYSGGDSIRIEWTNGPAEEDVKAIAQKFENVSRCRVSGGILSGGNSYIFTERNYSPVECETCNGSRQVQIEIDGYDESIKQHYTVFKPAPCPTCSGRGQH